MDLRETSRPGKMIDVLVPSLKLTNNIQFVSVKLNSKVTSRMTHVICSRNFLWSA